MSAAPGPSTGTATQKMFISYRRGESAAHAGRLHDAMVHRFGKHNVFIDVDLAPGVDFAERIAETISSCLVMIVVIGPEWATVEDGEGRPRLADPEDLVRTEAETGLHNSGVTCVPVLVDGAQMPRYEDLPSSLRTLTRRNAQELSNTRWSYDVDRLSGFLGEMLTRLDTPQIPMEQQKPSPPAPTPAPAPASWRLVPEGMLVAGATAFAARWVGKDIPEGDKTETLARIAGLTLRRTETWALTAIALALWLALRTHREDRLELSLLGLVLGTIGGALAGAVFAIPVHLPDPNLGEDAKMWLEVPSMAIAGAFLGALIGAIWRPPRIAVAIVCGLSAGALTQLLIGVSGWNTAPDLPASLRFGLVAAAIAGSTLVAMLVLDRDAADGAGGNRGAHPGPERR